jgi:hypothetical protein
VGRGFIVSPATRTQEDNVKMTIEERIAALEVAADAHVQKAKEQLGHHHPSESLRRSYLLRASRLRARADHLRAQLEAEHVRAETEA